MPPILDLKPWDHPDRVARRKKIRRFLLIAGLVVVVVAVIAVIAMKA